MADGWVLEVEIKQFFDTMAHEHLREILNQRVHDGVILRLIGKRLNAGVMEGAMLSHPESGSPQGGVVSPLLANIYLHEVLDEWFVHDVRALLFRRIPGGLRPPSVRPSVRVVRPPTSLRSGVGLEYVVAAQRLNRRHHAVVRTRASRRRLAPPGRTDNARLGTEDRAR